MSMWRRLSVGAEWGVSHRIVTELRERLKVRATAACECVEAKTDVVWLEPKTFVEVQYDELLQGRLRDPVLRGIRTVC